jgi:hypothetical protein
MLPPPTDDQVQEILAKHGLPCDGLVERCLQEGVVNHVRFVGDLCLRTLKEPNYASDVWTETVAVPAVVQAGAMVPALLAFDCSQSIVPTLVTIYRRVPGEPLGALVSLADPASIYRQLGEQIGTWHRNVRTVPDPHGHLDRPEFPNPRQVVAQNEDRLSVGELRWVDALLTRLGEAQSTERGFVHWDLHVLNVLVHEGRLSSVLDWGDAGWADAAINFHCLPAEYLPEALDGFGSQDSDFIGRCLLGVVLYALNGIHRPDDAMQPYRNTGHRRWRSLIRLMRRELDEPWQRWLMTPP